MISADYLERTELRPPHALLVPMLGPRARAARLLE
jgi:hypothetical protein